jgi:hypothetical protein
MKMTITAAGGEPVILCDHGREGPAGLLPVPLRKVDINEFVQGLFSKPKNRGNTLNQLSFIRIKEHENYTAAQLYLFLINETVPTGGTLLIELDDQVTQLEALNATVELAPMPIVGVLTTVSYTIKYGAVSIVSLGKTLTDNTGATILTSDGKTIITKETP